MTGARTASSVPSHIGFDVLVQVPASLCCWRM
jgi:hypothetical protein